jgi:hypothetical protein
MLTGPSGSRRSAEYRCGSVTGCALAAPLAELLAELLAWAVATTASVGGDAEAGGDSGGGADSMVATGAELAGGFEGSQASGSRVMTMMDAARMLRLSA